MKKTVAEKSRATVPLKGLYHNFRILETGIIEKALVKHLQASLNRKSFTVSFSFFMIEAENSI
jgi:hypothetical protein